MRHDFTAEQGIFIVQFAVGHERSAHVPRLVACQFFFCMIQIIIPCLDYFFSWYHSFWLQKCLLIAFAFCRSRLLVCIRLHNVIKWKQEMRFLWVRSAACIFYPKPAEEKRAQ